MGCTGQSKFPICVSGTGGVGVPVSAPAREGTAGSRAGAWAGIGAEEEEELLCQAKFLCYPLGFLHESVASASRFWDSPFTQFS